MTFFETDTVHWQGWHTTWRELRRMGWDIDVVPAYYHLNDLDNSSRSHKKIYIRHTKDRMIGRIANPMTYGVGSGSGHWVLDFLIQEHNQRISPAKILTDGVLTEKDIPGLLGIIADLQAGYKKRRKKLPVADIFELMRKVA